MIKLIPLSLKGYELPEFKISRKGDWFEYGTEKPYKNLYPDFLVKLYNESSKHNTIINTKTNFIVGKGFQVVGNTTFSERALLEGFLRHPNEYENSNALLTKLVKDKKVFGGFALQIRLNSNKKIASIDHLDFSNLRVATEEGKYLYTNDWASRNPPKNEDFKELEYFPFNDQVKTNGNYLICYKEYRPDLGEYPLPDYIAAVPYLEADAEIANFTLQNIKNNLSSGYVVSFNNGQPTDEEMSEIERRFKDYATGTDNAGKPLLSFTDQNADHPQITPIPTNGQDDRFINLNDQITQEIFTAHGVVSPMLFGIKDQTGLGNNADELRTAFDLYQNLQIDNEQDIFNDLFNELMAFNGLPKALKIIKVEPVSKPLSEGAMISVMTKDEIREKIGLEPLKPEQRVQMDDQFDEMIFNQLKNYGFSKNNFEVLETHHEMIKCFEDAEAFERKVLEKYDFILPRVLTEFEKNVLGMIVKNPSLPNIELSKALQVSIQDINETIANLQNIGALDVEFNPTKAAESSIQRPTEEIFVVYSYEKNPKQTGEPTLLDTSRTFCRQMIGLDRLYTLDQLKLLRNDFNQSGLDIFTKRGGWYTLPGTTNHRPFCRHIWRQNVVRRKL